MSTPVDHDLWQKFWRTLMIGSQLTPQQFALLLNRHGENPAMMNTTYFDVYAVHLRFIVRSHYL